MLKAFRMSLLLGFLGVGAAVLFNIYSGMAYDGLPLLALLLCEALALLLYVRRTRGVPMSGRRAKLLSYLMLGFMVGGPVVSRAAESSLLLTAAMMVLWLLQLAAVVWFEWKFVRCPACGKHLPLFGDFDQCVACHIKVEDAPS